ncbi:MAG: hypothetical protein Q8R96_19890 [Bacteroidota bacterium]|nr:hypothetical protein [Bacteroidota bacterium]
MKKSIIIFVLSVFTCSFGAFAQLKVNSSGNIGIDTDSPASRFSIGAAGYTNSKAYIFNSNASSSQKGLEVSQALTNGDWSYGTISSVFTGNSSTKVVGVRGSGYKSTAYTSGMSFGVYGLAGNATTGYNYGVFGQIFGTNNGAAIFASTPGYAETSVNGIYAGYFRGKVFIEDKVGIKTTSPSYDLDVNGTIRCVSLTQTSDLGIKKDVRNIDKGSLRNVANLNGVKTTQNINLLNGWNIFSANVLPEVRDMMPIVQPLINAGQLVKVMDEAGNAIEDFGTFGGWVNNIGNIQATEGYKVNVNANCVLEITGDQIALPLSISLTSGWNIISFPQTIVLVL